MATPTLRKTDRYFMQLAYNGLPFHGWQRQPNAISVQQKVEEALAMVFREPEIQIVGAGRTDAGVSAAKMIAHFDLPREVTDDQHDEETSPRLLDQADNGAEASPRLLDQTGNGAEASPRLLDQTGNGAEASRLRSQPRITQENEERILRALNSILAPDIVVYRIWKVHSDAHARFDAVSRSYRYFAHTRRSPFTGHFSWLAPATLDFRRMNEAAAILLDTEDFTSFSKLHTDVKTNICHVTHAAWRPQDAPDCEVQSSQPAQSSHTTPRCPTMWVFEITADRFLRNMVRAVVGTLVDVGRGKLSVNDFRTIIDRRDRCAAGTSMPPGPLFLHDVRYPY